MTSLGFILVILGGFAAAAWAWLLIARGGFWRADQFLSAAAADLAVWPAVAAIIPARNEADVIGRALTSIAAQDYPGDLSVIVVDDGSDDGTADVARAVGNLDIVDGAPLPEGWSGKLWAVRQGVAHARSTMPSATFLWLTDADIDHAPDELRQLVGKAETDSRDLVSLMVRLHCGTLWERLLIPAFVFFFQKLYPFPWVNAPTNATAAAAGGSMLLRRSALDRIGGIEAIKSALIDDCALARAVKPGGAIWLGLTRRTHSLRVYRQLGDIWAMVARTAFDQLGYSWIMLAGTVAGMIVLYIAPPALVVGAGVHGSLWATLLGALGWVLLAVAFRSTARLYGRSVFEAFLLPIAAFLYVVMTVDSARRHVLGRGGGWKARTYARPGNDTAA